MAIFQQSHQGSDMLTVEQAQALVVERQQRSEAVLARGDDLYGRILAQDIVSSLDLPLFDSSAMDGFALRSSDSQKAARDSPVFLEIVDEIWAGKVSERRLAKGACARIMTGAMVPAGADAVVMQEDVEVQGGKIMLKYPIVENANIRRRGCELHCGDLLLNKGTRLNPAGLGCLAAAGICECSVYRRPQVTIIPTGTELVSPGGSLAPGQIYESNSVALKAAMAELGITASVLPSVPDDTATLSRVLKDALRKATHVIVCGGVSVGEHDHNKAVLRDLKVEEIFWCVAQKPGKPLFFGMRDKTSVFGLPGNPASSLVCYYEYIRPALLKFMGFPHEVLFLPEGQATILEPLNKKRGKAHFLRGQEFIKEGKNFVRVFSEQDSHMMTSFAQSNCLVVLPEHVEYLDAGSSVTIQRPPGIV